MSFFILVLIAIVVIIAVNVYQAKKEHEEMERYNNGNMSEEEQKEYEAKLKAREEYKEKMRKSQTISKVMIVGGSSDSRKKVGSSLMRGAIGGALLGPVGLVGGALSGKNKITNETTFLIEYEDGHRETKTVDNNSSEFERLCKYLEM